MGRAKVTLKCIEKERARAQTFKGRIKGLKKKMDEFSTKTGAEACLIVYEGNGKSQPMTWPQESEKVRSIIENYEARKIVKLPEKFDLEDYFENRKNMVQDEISKVRKDIIQIKYPTWNQNLSSLDEENLMKFITILDTKIIACDQQIGMLKTNHQGGGSNFNFGHSMVQSESVSLVSNLNLNPNPNQLNFKQNTNPQIHVIPDPNPNTRMSFNHYNQLSPYVDHGFGGSQSQMSYMDPNPMLLVAENDDLLVGSANQVGMQQNNVAIMDPITNDQFGEFLEWTGFGDEGENWASQPNDPIDWISEYFIESEFQNVPINHQDNVSQPLNTIPPPTLDEVLIYDYNNLFQDLSFYNMNQ